jgi:methyl-accepting chemotaxis protein
VSRDFLDKNARREVSQQAQLMMEAAIAMRHYTTENIKPLLKEESETGEFIEETVPAFAAQKTFGFIRHGDWAEYSYREATNKPTNLKDRALDFEADLIQVFNDQKDRKEIVGERNSAEGARLLYLARPLAVEKPCLRCHSSPEVAPASMLKEYGNENGFRWKEGEIVAVQVVSVPMSIPKAISDRALVYLTTWMGIVTALTLLAFNVAMVWFIIRPVGRLSAWAEEISTGALGLGTLPVRGKDEIATLTESFNRMYRSLRTAMNMLRKKK